MAINGIESLIWGVKNVSESVRYFSDMGVPLVERNENYARFRFAEGSSMVFRHCDDPALPKADTEGDGVREVIWGEDSDDGLAALHADLSRDHAVTEDGDGTFHLKTSFGLAYGFRRFQKLPVVTALAAANSIGNVNRLNQARKWRRRAVPKGITHTAFMVTEPETMLDFFRDRLGFRVTDLQPGLGIYLRAPGASDHHNAAMLDSNAPQLLPISGGKVMYNHVNLLFEDIDELMVAKAAMERSGWPKSSWGLGRHDIASSAFVYLDCPGGGEVEMCADMDQVDDSWIPRMFEFPLGLFMFVHDRPAYLPDVDVDWVLKYCDAQTVRFSGETRA